MASVIRTFLFLCLCCSSFYTYGQHSKIDSINSLLKTSKFADPEKVQLMIELAKLYIAVDPDSSFTIAHRALSISIRSQEKHSEINTSIAIAQLFTYSGNYDSSLIYCNKAIEISRGIKDNISLANAYNAISWVYYWRVAYDKALIYADSCIELQKELNNAPGLVNCYINLGAIYISLRKYDNALDYLLKAQALLPGLNLPREQARCYASLGEIYTDMGESDKGLAYFYKNLKISEELNDIGAIQGMYNNIGAVFFSIKNYSKALEYNTKSLDISQKIGDHFTQHICLYNRGNIYFEMGNHQHALELFMQALSGFVKLDNKEWVSKSHINIGRIETLQGSTEKKGINNLRKGLAIALTLNNKQDIANAAVYLANVYKKIKKYPDALEFTELYHRYQDSLDKEDISKRLQTLQYSYEIEKRESTITNLKKDKLITQKKDAVKSIIVIALIISSLIITVFSLLLRRKNRMIKEQHEEIRKYAVNLTEINHFKDSILSILSHDLRGPLLSIKAVFALIDYDIDLSPREKTFLTNQLKKQLDSTNILLDNLLLWASASQKSVAPTAPENLNIFKLAETNITLLWNISEAKKLRIENNIPRNMSASGNYNQVDTVIRNLLANAIKYTSETGSIVITARKEDNMVCISITDSGMGMTTEELNDLFNGKKEPTYGTMGERGVGLGLKISKEFIEANGGVLHVTSILDEGSIFSFTLPAIADA